MDTFAQALKELADTLKRPDLTPELLRQPLVALLQLGEQANPTTRNALLEQIALLMTITGISQASFLAIACGALVEIGADPLRGLTPLVMRTREALVNALPFIEACQKTAIERGESMEEPEVCVEAVGEQVAAQAPREAAAYGAVPYLCQAMTAFLGHSKEARRIAHADEQLFAACQGLPFDPGFVEFLRKLLLVLDDEEMVVLHPQLGCGYRIQISGIGDNFQLHTLLADALIGDPAQGWLPGNRPDARVAALAKDAPFAPENVEGLPSAEGRFNLVMYPRILCGGLQSSQVLF